MSKADILERLKQAIIELQEDEVPKLLKEGLEMGVAPLELIMDGLSPGLTFIGEAFEKQQAFMSDLVIAGEIMNDAVEMLRPVMEAGGEFKGETMVIGTVEGDQHNIGKRIVSAVFTGAGYRVVDIGENMPADEFVKAAKDLNATIVGASAILSPSKTYCKVIHEALVDAGIRDKVIYIIGGWNMTQEWCDALGADCYGENAIDALHKVSMIRAGELSMLRMRAREPARVRAKRAK
jgi:dimethylamine corrinoid protein